jgi:hypothetical protein
MFIWLLFIVFPLINAIGKRGPALRHGLVIAGAAAFVAAYVALVLIWRQRRSDVTPWLPVGILVAVASALTFAEGSSWGFLFTYCAACMALVSPSPAGFVGVLLCAALAAGGSSISGRVGAPHWDLPPARPESDC